MPERAQVSGEAARCGKGVGMIVTEHLTGIGPR
jgi:hypothetical protein